MDLEVLSTFLQVKLLFNVIRFLTFLVRKSLLLDKACFFKAQHKCWKRKHMDHGSERELIRDLTAWMEGEKEKIPASNWFQILDDLRIKQR